MAQPRRLAAGEGPADDGLLHPRGHPLLLRPGRRLHRLRRLSLLGVRADHPQPPVPVHRHQRALRRPLRPPGGDQRRRRQLDRRRQPRRQGLRRLRLDHLRRASRGGRGELEALPGIRQLRRQPARLLQGLPRPGRRRAAPPQGPRLGRGLDPRERLQVQRRGDDRRLRQGCAERRPAPGLVAGRPHRRLRAPRRLPQRRRGFHRRHHRGAGRQPEGVRQDRLHPQLRRERRLLRPRPPPTPAITAGAGGDHRAGDRRDLFRQSRSGLARGCR